MQKKVGWLGSAALGLGGANLSLILIGTLISSQGTYTIPLLLLGMLIAYIANLGYLELVLMYPEKVGGIAAVCADAFRPYNPILTNLAGTCYWFAWITLTSYGAIYTATIIQSLFLPHVSINLLATVFICAIALINLKGLVWTQRAAIPFALIAVLLALVSGFVPILTGSVNWDQAFNYQLKTPFPGWFGNITSFLAGLYLIGWITPAYETVLCYVGETKNPQRNVKIAAFVCVGLAILYYVISPIVWLGTVGADNLTKDLSQTLIPTFSPMFGKIAHIAAGCFVMFNMIICIFAPVTATSRTLYQLSHEGMVPSFLGKLNSNEAPANAIIMSTLTAAIITWTGSPMWLIAATNFQYLLCISLASIAVVLLRRDAPNAKRLYRAPKGFIFMGLITVLIWCAATIFGFQQYGLSTMIIGVTFSFFGIILYSWRKMVDRKKAGLSLFPRTLHLKLTGTMLAVLAFDAIGYLIAINSISQKNPSLIVALEDIFVVVAIITLSVGLILPGMIAYAASNVNEAAKKLINGPLQDLSDAMKALGSGNLDAAHADTKIFPIQVHTKDEIGEMAHTFNRMQKCIQEAAQGLDKAREGLLDARRELVDSNVALSELNETLETRVNERTHDLANKNELLSKEITDRQKAEVLASDLNKKLVIAARQAGMADIATSVLHNVGNVLNTINITVTLLREKIKNSKVSRLSSLSAMIKQNQGDLIRFLTEDQKGKKIPDYLHVLAETWEEEKSLLVQEIKILETNTQHIKDIIVKQNAVSRMLGVNEEVDITDALEQALTLSKINFVNIEFKIIKDYQIIKKVVTDRVKLMQIFVNLIKNALESIVESKNEMKLLKLSVFEQGNKTFCVQIIDSGVGVAVENLAKVFSHGFTTKEKGHGFGLHSSALAAKEMGGSLTIESEGIGKGATLTLLLPYHIPESKIHHHPSETEELF